MCAYVSPQCRCLHLFISGQMLVVVEIERERVREGRGDGLPPFTLSSFTLVIKPKWDKIRGDLGMKNDILNPFMIKFFYMFEFCTIFSSK